MENTPESLPNPPSDREGVRVLHQEFTNLIDTASHTVPEYVEGFLINRISSDVIVLQRPKNPRHQMVLQRLEGGVCVGVFTPDYSEGLAYPDVDVRRYKIFASGDSVAEKTRMKVDLLGQLDIHNPVEIPLIPDSPTETPRPLSQRRCYDLTMILKEISESRQQAQRREFARRHRPGFLSRLLSR